LVQCTEVTFIESTYIYVFENWIDDCVSTANSHKFVIVGHERQTKINISNTSTINNTLSTTQHNILNMKKRL